MTRVRWTPEAAEDLQRIHDFVARGSAQYALAVVERILEAIEQLEAFPLSGRRLPEANRQDLRELIRPPYRIVYRMAGEAVHIVTVFQSSQPWPASLT